MTPEEIFRNAVRTAIAAGMTPADVVQHAAAVAYDGMPSHGDPSDNPLSPCWPTNPEELQPQDV